MVVARKEPLKIWYVLGQPYFLPSLCMCPFFRTRQAASLQSNLPARACMRLGSDFNTPNLRTLYTAKASAPQLHAFRTLPMSGQAKPSALTFELKGRCSVSAPISSILKKLI